MGPVSRENMVRTNVRNRDLWEMCRKRCSIRCWINSWVSTRWVWVVWRRIMCLGKTRYCSWVTGEYWFVDDFLSIRVANSSWYTYWSDYPVHNWSWTWRDNFFNNWCNDFLNNWTWCYDFFFNWSFASSDYLIFTWRLELFNTGSITGSITRSTTWW